MRYCKSTSFQANHNGQSRVCVLLWVVCDTAKVRVFKQITTNSSLLILLYCCLRYCKSTSFQANHNYLDKTFAKLVVVCDTAKVRVFKQITTGFQFFNFRQVLFAILQKYEFSSKSQHTDSSTTATACCLRYCKSTSFQANHNFDNEVIAREIVVCDTAKVRVFKQITTALATLSFARLLFAILQKYEFSSKSQQPDKKQETTLVVCDTANVRVFKQITTSAVP